MPEEALRAMKAAATNPVEETFAGLMLFCAGGDEIDMRETLGRYPVPDDDGARVRRGVLPR